MTDERNIAEDARTITRAAANRWPIPENVRAACVARMTKVLTDPNASHRDAAAATRALAALDQQNQSDEHKAKPDPGLNLNITPEELARMSDEELRERTEQLRRALGSRRT